jgi:hypothetical protein
MNRQQRRAGAKAQRSTKKLDSKFEFGKLTVTQEGDGWIVLEDGRLVGGTLREPFVSRADALRWVKRERADYEEALAAGDFAGIARVQLIRRTDPELWARYEEVVQETNLEFGDEKFPEEQWHFGCEAHEKAGTLVLALELMMIELEAGGLLTAPDARGERLLTDFGLRQFGPHVADAVKARTQAHRLAEEADTAVDVMMKILMLYKILMLDLEAKGVVRRVRDGVWTAGRKLKH